MVGGSKLMASLLGANLSDIGLRTSFLGFFWNIFDINSNSIDYLLWNKHHFNKFLYISTNFMEDEPSQANKSIDIKPQM